MTIHLIELVYGDPIEVCVERLDARGSLVHLHRRSSCPLSAEALAELVDHPMARSVSVDGEIVIVEFADAEAAASVRMDGYLFATGDYRVETSSSERMVLVRRRDDESGPHRIEVVAVASEDEEWRRLLAGEFDLMPEALQGSVMHLEQIPSLRRVDFAAPGAAALWFRIAGNGPTSDMVIRQAIALAIRREPLVATIGLPQGKIIAGKEDLGIARQLLRERGISATAPLALTMLVFAGEPDLVRAAMVLQQQLASVDIAITVRSEELEEFAQHMIAGQYDLLLFRGVAGPASWRYLRTSGDLNFCGYSSAEFDRATEEGRPDDAAAILAREVPTTLLFSLSQVAVVNRRLCNVHPKRTSDLTWLADVRPCRQGESD